MSSSRLSRGIFTALGSVSLGLGVLGIFLPLLPTTPFLLLAAACYLRGSPRLGRWLLEHPLLGRYIRDYREGRGMPLRAKIVALALLWTTIGLSALLVVQPRWGKLLLLGVAVGVTVHLLRLGRRGAP